MRLVKNAEALPIFSQRLKELRMERSLGQVALAESIGVSKAVVSMWETGKREPSMTSLIALANFYGVSIDYIVGLTD